MPTKPKVVAFDIIETVFSLESLRDRLVALGLPETALEAWFAAGLRGAVSLAVTDPLSPFPPGLEAALPPILARHHLAFDPDKASSVQDGMKSLQAPPDAADSFLMLSDAGLRVLALSNGAASATEALLSGAGLDAYVERVLSVDDVKLSKPRRE